MNRLIAIPALVLSFPFTPSNTALAANEWQRLHGGSPGENAGRSVASAGDVNLDGFTDVIVGSPNYDNPLKKGTEEGRAIVYSGADGEPLHEVRGQNTGARVGTSVAGIGDVNGDGYPDFAVGGPRDVYAFFEGTVRVYSGKDGAELYVAFAYYTPSTHAGFGNAIAPIDDIDHDGVDDFAVSAPYASTFTTQVIPQGGWVFIRSGATGAPILEIDGKQAYGRFGTSVARGPDLDQDGVDDILVGQPFYDAGNPAFITYEDIGRVLVYSTKTGNLLGIYGGTIAEVGYRTGFSVATTADVDGDGIADIAAGAPFADASGDESGLVRTWSSATGQILWSQAGSVGSRLGYSIAPTSDQNGDGRTDLIVGAPNMSFGTTLGILLAGAVRVTSSVNGQQIDLVSPKEPLSVFGTSVAAIDDLDGDGRDDLIGGAFGYGLSTGFSSVFVTNQATAGFANYGTPVAGTLGVPGLTMMSSPVPCQPNAILLDNPVGQLTSATLFVGFTDTNLQTGYGGSLYVSPALVVPMVLTPGQVAVPFDPPCNPLLIGASLFAQALIADAGAPLGVAFSPGLRINLGL